MAGVVVDHYGFIYDLLTPPATGLTACQWYPCGSGVSTDPPRQGGCHDDSASPCCTSPFYRTLQWEARLKGSEKADTPVEINPPSQCMQWFGPRAQPQGNAVCKGDLLGIWYSQCFNCRSAQYSDRLSRILV